MRFRGCTNKVKGICSVISAVLMRLLIGNLLTFPNIISYYQVFSDFKFTKNQLYFVAPAGLFTFFAFVFPLGFLDEKVGTRVSTIIGSVCILAYQLLMYFVKVFAVLIISYILLGLGGALTYVQTLINCWKYFPERRGLISGFLFSSSGLGAFIFTSIADGVVKSDEKDEKKKNEQIVKGFKLYLLISLFFIIVFGISASILCFPYVKMDEYIAGLSLIPDEDSEESEDQIPKDENSDESKEKDKNKEKKEGKTLKELILTIDFLMCLIISICTLIFGFLLTNTYRVFGELSFIKNTPESYSNDEKMKKYLKALSKVFTLANAVGRLIWGFISDKVGFKILYSIVCIIQIICGATIYFAANNIAAYFIVTNVGILGYAGHVTLFPGLINTMFGIEKSLYLIGICGFFNGIAALIGPILTIFVLKEKKDYLVVYLVCAAPSIVSLIVTILLKIDKKPKEEPKEKIIDDHYYDEVEEIEKEELDKTGVELSLNKSK